MFPVKTFLIFLFAIVLVDNAVAQQNDSNGYIHRPAQVTFIYPVGSNGIEAGRVVNKFSINLLAGYAAGLEGVEFGGFTNVEKDYVHGAQFAGFSNIVLREVEGAQFAGFANYAGSNSRGAQFAGFTNVAMGDATLSQFSGFANLVKGSNRGVMAAGFTNVSFNMEGVQVAGFANVVAGDMVGAQIAGFANVASGNLKGVQVAGCANIARIVTGSQIGFFNYSDSITGIPIGFLSIVKNGYHHFEVGASESIYPSVALKLGVQHFYNIFSIGIRPASEDLIWAPGYGLGTAWDITNRVGVNFDAIAYQINEDFNRWTNGINLLNVGRLNGSYDVGRLKLFAGPALNVLVSDVYDPVTQEYGSGVAPKNLIFESQEGRVNVKMWLGLNGGVRF